MLQRSPSYIGSLPLTDPFAEQANKWLPTKLAHAANRWKWVAFSTFQYQFSRKFPKQMRKTLLTMAKRRLPEGYDVEKHFGPSYNPWDQRLCLAPNGDLFKTIRNGQADVVTDTIDRFTKTGIKLNSGQELEADIIITATGLNLQLFGGAQIRRNGERVDLNQLMAYKGMMLTGMAYLIRILILRRVGFEATGLYQSARVTEHRQRSDEKRTFAVGHRPHRAGHDDRRQHRRRTRERAGTRASPHELLREHTQLRLHLG